MRKSDWLAALETWRGKTLEEQSTHFRSIMAPGRGPSPDGRARVGMLCPCLVMGGAEAWQLTLGRYTDPARVDWKGCCVLGEERRIDPAMLAATSALMPVTVGVEAARRLAGEVDVLVVWAIDGVPKLLAGMADPPKVVSVVHAPIESQWGQTVYARARGIDRWVAVSELALEALPESSRAVPTSIVWNAVDADRLEVRRDRETMRKLWGIPAGARVAGYLGRLSHEKDPHAMTRLAEALPDPWRVVVVGAGDERLGTADRLHPVGVDPSAGDVLNAFDVLVVPSDYESFGLTIAEGIWMRTPVVSTDVGIARIWRSTSFDGCGPTRLIPTRADGPTLAEAVLKAGDPGGDPARESSAEALRAMLGPARFGSQWTALLTSLVPAPAKFDPARHRALGLMILGCDYRGGPALECGCTKTRICHAGKGRPIADSAATDVTDDDCRACVQGR